MSTAYAKKGVLQIMLCNNLLEDRWDSRSLEEGPCPCKTKLQCNGMSCPVFLQPPHQQTGIAQAQHTQKTESCKLYSAAVCFGQARRFNETFRRQMKGL